MYYVYFLLLSNGKIYTGSSANPKERFAAHTGGRVISTKPFRPIHMVGYEAYALKSDAQRRERFMKTTEGKRLFKQQFRDIILKLSPKEGKPGQ